MIIESTAAVQIADGTKSEVINKIGKKRMVANKVAVYPGKRDYPLDPKVQEVAEQLRVMRDDLGVFKFDEKLPVCAIECEIGPPEKQEAAKVALGINKPKKDKPKKAKKDK